jgi:hypothetical protein
MFGSFQKKPLQEACSIPDPRGFAEAENDERTILMNSQIRKKVLVRYTKSKNYKSITVVIASFFCDFNNIAPC